MPLARVDLVEGRSDEQLAVLADTIYQVERDVFSAPEDDRYVVITEHRPGRMFLGSTGLGYQRSADAMVIQITEQNRDRDRESGALSGPGRATPRRNRPPPGRSHRFHSGEHARRLVIRTGARPVPYRRARIGAEHLRSRHRVHDSAEGHSVAGSRQPATECGSSAVSC